MMTDVFSEYTQAVPTHDQQASTVAKVSVNNCFCRFGVPSCILSDQGRNFESNLIQRLCSMYGIEKSRTTPYRTAGNGHCELFLHTLPATKKKGIGRVTCHKSPSHTTPQPIRDVGIKGPPQDQRHLEPGSDKVLRSPEPSLPRAPSSSNDSHSFNPVGNPVDSLKQFSVGAVFDKH